MGVLDRVSEYFDIRTFKKKHRAMQTVKIKVKMDCEGCERKVKSAVSSIKGVRSVEVNRKQSLVVVSGYIEPKKVLEEVKSTGKVRAQLWPYVAHDLVAYPYVPEAYDKRAPSGYVRNVPQAHADPNEPGEVLANFFNEEDPNACSIM